MTKRHQTNSNYQMIWGVVKKIPRGKVATYGEIARLSGLLGQARQVGYALHALPPGSNVPWYRVINSQGKISLPRSNGQYTKQKRLLEKEGVVFRKAGVNLNEFGCLRCFDESDRRLSQPAGLKKIKRRSRDIS
jgi:methylated-DNA-protein-cysteine methyltransferase-like protein